MSLISLLDWHKARDSGRVRGGRRGRRPERRYFMPRLEVLEGRTLPSTLTVLNNADSGPGSLRAAIAAANNGDRIDFAPALTGQTITLTSGELAVTKSLDIEGPGANNLAVSGNDASRVFDVLGGAVTISGLTITHGLANAGAPVIPSVGGGILNLAALTVRNDILSDNQALGDARVSVFGVAGLAQGGGIGNVGALTISNSTFTANQVQGGSGSSSNFFPGNSGGGGLCNDPGGIASVTDSQFTFNLAKGGNRSSSAASGAGIAGGGAIENTGATLTVTRSTFSYNQAIGGNDNVSAYLTGLGFGGAIKSGTQTTAIRTNSGIVSTANPELVVSDSTFDHNQAIGGNGNQVTTSEPNSLGADNGIGGGVLVFGGTAAISESTFHDNQALGGGGSTAGTGGLGAGGAIVAVSFAPGVSLTVSNSTVDHNSAVGGEGGAGGNGGDGWGGGLVTDRFSTLTVTASTIIYNEALGGQGQNDGERGAGVGGGVYNLGTASFDVSTVIDANHASTSNDDDFSQETSEKLKHHSTPTGLDVVSHDPNDWPMYTHDATGSRYNSAETRLRPDNVAGLHVEWTFPTQSAVAGTPAVVDGVVYAVDASGTVYAVSSDGEELWQHRVTVHPAPALPAAFALATTTSLLVTNHTIIFGDLGGDIHGLDINTGAELWTARPNDQPAASIFGSATMVGNDVAIGISSLEESAIRLTSNYVPSFRGSVVLLDPADGHVIWQTYTISQADRAAGATGAAVWSTPTYDPASNTLYVTTGNNYTQPTTATSDAFIALDAADGHIKWVHQLTQGDQWNFTFPPSPGHLDFDFADSPHIYTIAGRKVVGAGEKSGFFFVLDAATGAEISSPLQVSPAGSALGGVFADSAVANGVIYANGTNWANIYGPPLGGSLTAIAADGSKTVWQLQTPAPNESGVAVANGVVYFQSLDGNLYAVDAANGKVLATVHTGGSGRESGPAISRGQVYLGTGDVLGSSFNPTHYTGPGSIVALGLSGPFGEDDSHDGRHGDQSPAASRNGASLPTISHDPQMRAALFAGTAKQDRDQAAVGARLVFPSSGTEGGDDRAQATLLAAASAQSAPPPASAVTPAPAATTSNERATPALTHLGIDDLFAAIGRADGGWAFTPSQRHAQDGTEDSWGDILSQAQW